MSQFIPVSINIENRKILIVGGGNVALLKASGLSRFTSNITIVAPEILDKLREYPFTFIEKLYNSTDINHYFMVYACTNDKEINNQIKIDCNISGKLVAICDNPSESDIVMPAVCIQKGITVAVGTNGTSPKKGIHIRNQIQELLQSGVIDIETTNKQGE